MKDSSETLCKLARTWAGRAHRLPKQALLRIVNGIAHLPRHVINRAMAVGKLDPKKTALFVCDVQVGASLYPGLCLWWCLSVRRHFRRKVTLCAGLELCRKFFERRASFRGMMRSLTVPEDW